MRRVFVALATVASLTLAAPALAATPDIQSGAPLAASGAPVASVTPDMQNDGPVVKDVTPKSVGPVTAATPTFPAPLDTAWPKITSKRWIYLHVNNTSFETYFPVTAQVNSWNNYLAANGLIDKIGFTTTTSCTGKPTGQCVEVNWSASGAPGGGVGAVTTQWWSGGYLVSVPSMTVYLGGCCVSPYYTVAAFRSAVIGHEMGHMLGLGHHSDNTGLLGTQPWNDPNWAYRVTPGVSEMSALHSYYS